MSEANPEDWDFGFQIIPYRGGKALFIDSWDFMSLRSGTESESWAIRKYLDNVIEDNDIDFVMMISSMRPYMIRKQFNDWFNIGTASMGYRFLTERGRANPDVKAWVNGKQEKYMKKLDKIFQKVKDID